MKCKYVIFILLTVMLSSCSTGMSVLVKILGQESSEETLGIEFTFKDKALKEDVNISNIMIFKNDSLQYELEKTSDTTELLQWQFPYIPEGFNIQFPENEKSIRKFNKSDKLSFEFTGDNKTRTCLGEWQYKPSFLKNEHRWMFDNEGNKIVNIESFYESWIGKDIIKIYSDATLSIDNTSIKLVNIKNERVEFELRSKKDKQNIKYLTVENDQDTGEILYLIFDTKEGNEFSDEIRVPRKSSIGIFGKYR